MKKVALSTIVVLLASLLNAQTLTIVGNGNLRSGPSTNDKIIGKVTIGLKVKQFDYCNDWYKIEVSNDLSGWIHKSLVKQVKQNNIVNSQTEVAGTFIDTRDGKVYKTVKIGMQTWMAENLAFKTNFGCWAYDENQINVATYGYLYTYAAAIFSCPAGWHLPNSTEWNNLINDLGGPDIAGDRLKSKSKWICPCSVANNSSGFTAIPGGGRRSDGSYYRLDSLGLFWSADSIEKPRSEYYGISSEYSSIGAIYCEKDFAFSVRCIKSDTTNESVSKPLSMQLIGSWRIVSSKNGSFLVTEDPKSEILEFKVSGIVDLNIESIKYSRGNYSISGNQIQLKFNHMSRSLTYEFDISNNFFVLKNETETIVLKKIQD